MFYIPKRLCVRWQNFGEQFSKEQLLCQFFGASVEQGCPNLILEGRCTTEFIAFILYIACSIRHSLKSFSLVSSQNVVSKCSDSCQPGKYKKTAEGQHTCCYECLGCGENQYSNHTGKFLDATLH